MKLTKKRSFIFKIILTALSLLSMSYLFYFLHLQMIEDKLYGGPHDPYGPLILYALLFLISGIIYWLMNKVKWLKIAQNAILVINLAFTISSFMSGWPAFIVNASALSSKTSELILIITIILGFIYTNIDKLTDTSRIILFGLKFICTLLAAGMAFYISLFVMIGGAAFLSMPKQEENLALFGMLVWILLNIAYGVVIWTKAFRSWWAWLLTVIFGIEICVPIIYAYLTELWQGIIISVIALILLFGMTYLNNKLKKE